MDASTLIVARRTSCETCPRGPPNTFDRARTASEPGGPPSAGRRQLTIARAWSRASARSGDLAGVRDGGGRGRTRQAKGGSNRPRTNRKRSGGGRRRGPHLATELHPPMTSRARSRRRTGRDLAPCGPGLTRRPVATSRTRERRWRCTTTFSTLESRDERTAAVRRSFDRGTRRALRLASARSRASRSGRASSPPRTRSRRRPSFASPTPSSPAPPLPRRSSPRVGRRPRR